LEWLYRTDFDELTVIALWSIAVVLATTIVLFVYTIGLRFATIVSDRRRARFVVLWRDVFAKAMLSESDAQNCSLPKLWHNDSTDLLEEWNRARSAVAGSALDNLIVLARRVAIPAIAIRLLQKNRVRPQILAVQTIGHLRDTDHREQVRHLVDHENTALSITAVVALVEIDPNSAVSTIIPMIEKRRDWPKNRVSIMLRMAGSERISEPMYRAIRSADNANKTYLMQFARLMDSEVLDALVDDLIRNNDDPGVLNAALKLVSGYGGVPRIAALTQHEAWFVRMQSAKVLGRIGQREHLSLLESLLDDAEWWVRYRAAQAITSLPFLGPNQLRQIRDRQTDRYAADILQQSFAEVGLA
jgi:hypothetical protein